MTVNSEFLHTFHKKMTFVTGKGGVGKSTYALELAKGLYQDFGGKILLVEIGKTSSVARLGRLDIEGQFQPKATGLGFDLSLIDGDSCLYEYLGHILKVNRLAKVFLENKLMKSLIPLAPGLDDLAILGKLTSKVRNHGPQWDYDTIIVDSPSTGAFLSMINAPSYLSEMVTRGPLNKQSREIHDVLSDESLCQYVFLTLPENFPVDELIESTKVFSENFNTPYKVVLNKALGEDRVLEELSASHSKFAKFYFERRSFQKEIINQLHKNFGSVNGMLLDTDEGTSQKDSQCLFLNL